MSDDPLMGVPVWYKDIFPQGEFDGFYRKLGNHAINYIERDPNQLVITLTTLPRRAGAVTRAMLGPQSSLAIMVGAILAFLQVVRHGFAING